MACLLAAAWALQGCGGGSDGTASAPIITELPSKISVTAAATAEPGTAMSFASDLANPGTGLRFSWDFGDGSVANGGSPSHSYAQPGDYTVVLSVSNETGTTTQARWTVAVRRSTMLQGAVCSAGASRGWCWQRPRPTGNNVLDIQWLNKDQAWAVGQTGSILRSTDSGVTWQPQTSGATTHLRKVQFFDSLHGWALGDENTLLHTQDGGASWQAQATGEFGYYGYAPQSLQAISASTALVLGSGGTARITRDGGETWTVAAESVNAIAADGTLWRQGYNTLSRSTDFGVSFTVVLAAPSNPIYFSQLRFSDARTAWLVASDFSSPQPPFYGATQTLWVTTDGGATWQTRALTGLAGLGASLESLTLYADGSAWLPAGGSLMRSTDGAQSFYPVTPTNASGGAFYVYGVTPLGPQAAVVQDSAGGQRFLTRDGGQTWQTMRLPSELGYFPYFDSVRMVGDGSLWLVASGRHFRSADSGNTWQQVFGSIPTPNGGNAALSAFWFHDERQGVAVSPGGWAAETTDGGIGWTQRALSSSSLYGSRGQLQFVSSTLGWMSLGGATLYRSTDGGKSWFSPLSSQISTGVRSFQFLDANQGYALLDDRRIVRSTDGGGNWEALGSLAADGQSLRFLDAQTGVVVGANGFIARTTDGGSSWKLRPSSTAMELRRLTVTPAGVLWTVGASGAMLRSDDRGLSWARLPAITTSTLNDIMFADAERGWAVGENGTVLATRDGGTTWQPQVSGTLAALLSVFALDAYTAWIGTGDGGVLATGTGGR